MTFLTLALLLLQPAEAHGMDAHHVALELDGAVVRVAATPGVDAFPESDLNGDAVLDRAEVATARSAMRARFEAAFHLEDPKGAAPACEPASISTIGRGEAHVRASLLCRFPTAPEALIVRMDALGWLPYTLEAVRIREVAPGRWASDGAVTGGMIPAGGGVATLLTRSPTAADATLRDASQSPGNTNDIDPNRASAHDPRVRVVVAVAVAGLLAALLAVRRARSPSIAPASVHETPPNLQGPTP